MTPLICLLLSPAWVLAPAGLQWVFILTHWKLQIGLCGLENETQMFVDLNGWHFIFELTLPWSLILSASFTRSTFNSTTSKCMRSKQSSWASNSGAAPSHLREMSSGKWNVNLKSHPFTTHPHADPLGGRLWWHFQIQVTVLEFHGGKLAFFLLACPKKRANPVHLEITLFGSGFHAKTTTTASQTGLCLCVHTRNQWQCS